MEGWNATDLTLKLKSCGLGRVELWCNGGGGVEDLRVHGKKVWDQVKVMGKDVSFESMKGET